MVVSVSDTVIDQYNPTSSQVRRKSLLQKTFFDGVLYDFRMQNHFLDFQTVEASQNPHEAPNEMPANIPWRHELTQAQTQCPHSEFTKT